MNCEKGGLRTGSVSHKSTGDRYFCGRILPWNFILKADTVYFAIHGFGLNTDKYKEEIRLHYYSQNPSTAITTSQIEERKISRGALFLGFFFKQK